MEGSRLQNLREIVQYYDLKLKFTERHGRVIKIYTDKGDFALKEIDARHGLDFLHYIQQLFQLGYNRIVPIYPTVDGRYGVLANDSLYYLMPWLENKEEENRYQKHLDLFREIARLHMLTVREVPVEKEDREEHYQKTKARWEIEQQALEKFVEQSEKELYMSPFQLQFCTMYSEIAGGQQYALNKLSEWYEATKERTKARSVIIHGKLSHEHFLYDEKGYGYFSNFEKTTVASPIHDLLPYLDRTFHTFPQQFDQSLKWLDAYFRHFPFKDEEMLLFLSYLAHPGPIFRTIEKYFSSGKEKSEIRYVMRLQKQYWRMKNTEYVVMKLDEMERKMKEEAQSSPSD